MSDSVAGAAIWKWDDGAWVAAQDQVTVEAPLQIILQSKTDEMPFAVVMRTPGHDDELVYGLLYSEGIIEHAGQVEALHFAYVEGMQTATVHLAAALPHREGDDVRRTVVSSGCGICGRAGMLHQPGRLLPVSQNPLPAALLPRLATALHQHQSQFQQTGGVHACALFSWTGELLLLREDVGRHNAFDKLVGHALRTDRDLTHSIAITSSRASFDLVQKAARAGIPLLAAVGAPSSLAVGVARRHRMTLVGFLRDKRFNVYCGRERIEPR